MSAYPRGQGLQIEHARAASPVGPAFVALLLDDERGRADAVAALLSQLAGPETRVVRVDGRLRSLLTLDRAAEHAADAVARALAERQGRETQVVLLVEQAETLPLGTLRSLQAMAPYFVQAGRPALRVAFVGRPTFRALVADEEFAPLREALGFESDLGGGVGDLAGVARLRLARARRRALQVYLLAALGLLAGMAALIYWGLEAAPKPNAPTLAATPVAPLLPQPPPVTPMPAPASALEQSAPTSPPAETGQAQRDARPSGLLRQRLPQAQPTLAASAGPRVVVHVPDGPGMAALSARLLAVLGTQADRLQTRHVAAGPSRPSIRYFHPADAPAARLVEQRMAGVGLAWTVQDFTAFKPRPSTGTIEVWLPSLP